jgi:hypothetical protein
MPNKPGGIPPIANCYNVSAGKRQKERPHLWSTRKPSTTVAGYITITRQMFLRRIFLFNKIIENLGGFPHIIYT